MEEFPLKKYYLIHSQLETPWKKRKKTLRTFWVSQLSMFIKSHCVLKNVQSYELTFIWGKIRTGALKRATQIALRNYSEEAEEKVSIYVILVNTYFSGRFLLVS